MTRTKLIAVAAALVLVSAGVTYAVGANQATLVNQAPSAATPNINDGNIFAMVQIGTRIIVGGNFTNANPPGDTNAAHKVTRHSILAFSAASGQIDTGFVPSLSGTVSALLPGPTADTVYIGGSFSSVDGVSSQHELALVSTVTGQPVAGFTPSGLNGQVLGLARTGTRLTIGGEFTTVGGVSHQGLAALDPNTGAVDNAFVNVQFTGHHNHDGDPTGANGAVGVEKMDLSPDGTKLIATGNFKHVNGALHDQIAVLNVSSSSVTLDSGWNTAAYSATCNSSSFDTYMRGVSFSPDSSYFVVVTTGGTGGVNTDGTRALCDTAVRWNTSDSGSDVKPAWIQFSGKDSFESVTVAGAAVYVGGHFRWLNNSAGEDQAGEGGVPRPGLGALDPVNGMPYAWNPGRTPRGEGAYTVYATANGLYAGGDNNYISTGATRVERHRVSYFPLVGGEVVTPAAPAGLPANVYLAGETSGASPDVLRTVAFTGSVAGGATTVATSGIAWSQLRGGFIVGNKLFYGYTDGKLYVASFDGTTVGAPKLVDPYDDPTWQNVPTGSGQTYDGKAADLYGTEMGNVRGMFLLNGKLYYALIGQADLRYRYFEPDTGVVGSEEFTVSAGTDDFSNVAGMFISGATLYYAYKTTGDLHSVPWNNGAPSSGSDTVVSGPSSGGTNWATRAMFAMSSSVSIGSNFVPLAPSRILDTRSGINAPEAKIGAGGVVHLQVAGKNGVPASGATAVVLNVTAVKPTANTFITVYPDGGAVPTSSNLNLSTGQTLPNLVTVQVSNGIVDLRNQAGNVDLVADVTGYYTAGAGSLLTTMTPKRILDTRSGTGSGKASTVHLKVEGANGIPASGVTAVVMNVTAVNPTASSFLTVYPDGQAAPGVSNLNYVKGQTVANLVIVRVTDGYVDLHNNSGSVDLISDVTGYFTGTGSQFHSVRPVRLLDTRGGTAVGPNGTISLTVVNAHGVPASGVTAVVLNVTATQPTAARSFLTVYPDGVGLPNASNVNYVKGQTIANLVVVPVKDGKINFHNSTGTVQVIADLNGYFGS